MELIYTTQRDGFEQGRTYRNPRHFDQVEPGVESVVVIGDWPKVVDAYKAAGTDVSVIELAAQKASGGGGRDEAYHAEINGIREDLKAVTAITESFASQSLERPEGELGETAGRLFQVLDAVNAGIAGLQRERDGEVQKVASLEQEMANLQKQNADLLKQIESLKAASVDPEVEALKAKLDAAGVTYRANASKESLQKLVDDLSK
ncbi:hypothetical protein [Pseudomonas sichuanensis]|uniref:Uncharacterized protein n=1 Tax=Pseudomonas sichuanensis TaxID=2213015 RepID=A0ABV0DGG2_9PSED